MKRKGLGLDLQNPGRGTVARRWSDGALLRLAKMGAPTSVTFDPRERVEGFGSVPPDLNVGPSRPTDDR